MTINSALPILYPSRADELPVRLSVVDGRISSVQTTVDSVGLRFVKDASGIFAAETATHIDNSFLNHILVQLNRVYN